MANQFPRNGLTKSQVSLKLTGGIDRKTDPKQLQNGQMYTADNVQYTTEGQIRKRFGYNTLTPPGGLQGAPFAAVGVRDNVEPIVLGTGSLNRFNPVTGLSTSIGANTQGRLNSSSITSSSGISSIPSPPVNASCASDGQKYILVTWEEIDNQTNQLFYGVQDLTTGSWILSPTQITYPSGTTITANGQSATVVGSASPRALYYNGYFYIAFSFIATQTVGGTFQYVNQIQAYAINLLNLAAGLISTSMAQTLGGSLTSAALAIYTCGWDIALRNGTIYLAYTNSSTNGAGFIRTYTVSAQTVTPALTGTWTGQGATGSTYTYPRVSIAVGSSATVPIALTTPYSLLTLKADLTQNTRTDTPTGVDGRYCAITATVWNGNVAYGCTVVNVTGQPGLYYNVYGVNVSTNTQVLSATWAAPSTSVATGIVSRPFVYNNRLYIWLFNSGFAGWGVFRDQVLTEINLTTAQINFVARTSYQNAGLTNQPYTLVPNDIVNIPGSSKYIAFMTQTTEVIGGTPPTLGTADKAAVPAVISNSFYGTLTRAQFDFQSNTPSKIINLPTGGVFITGAMPLQYDGQSLVEAGYSAAPEFTTAPGLISGAPTPINGTASSAPNSKIAAGTYIYYVLFCRRDAYGNVIRSSPSAPIIITVTGTNNAVSFPAIFYSRVPTTYIEYYRTTLAIPGQPNFLARVANGASFVDQLADSAIASNPTLYTYSGEYPNDPPPAVHSMAVGETRAYIIPSDSRNSIWCSKKYAPSRSVEWTSNLILTEGGTHSGNFTAIAVLDTNVIVFKQDQILYFYGDGPDNAGATGTFSSFQRLSSDVGCIDPGSLAIIPAGLLFRSQRGIELLSRGLQVSYVGWPVEPLVQGITTIGSATVMPQYQQVRFVPSVAGEPTLVYDYLGNRWSTYSSMAATSSANVNGVYWWISADGSTCNIETPGLYLDAGGDFIPMTLETPEIPTTSIQGWGRIYRLGLLGEMKTSHMMTVRFAYDHQETYTDAVVYNACADFDYSNTYFYDNQGLKPASPTTTPGPYQFRFSRVPRQVMQTLRLKLQDAPLTVYYDNDTFMPMPLPFGESCAISNITLEIGQKAILAKLPGSQSV